MQELGLPVQFTFFSIGALLTFFFHVFAAFFLLTTKNAAKSTVCLGTASAFLAGNSLAFFLAYSITAPWIAYHRWLILAALPALVYYVRFFFLYPRGEHGRAERFFFAVLWLISLGTIAYYIGASWNAPLKFVFVGHYWTFDVPAADRFLGKVITALVLLTSGVGLWRAWTCRARERRNTLAFLAVMALIFLVPGVANELSRSGTLNRVEFMNIYVVSMVLGIFLLLVLYVNTTTDRTTFMGKIVGVTFATFLLLVQWTNMNALLGLEEARARLRESRAEMFAATGTRSGSFLYAERTTNDQNETATVFRRNDAGHPFAVAAVVRTPGSAAKLEVGFSYEEYRRYIHDAAGQIIYMLLIGGAIILVGFRLFFRGALGHPLQALLDGVERVNAGDLRVRIPVQVRDEFGFLTYSFNKMTRSVREARRLLENHAENLKREVARRTAELARLLDQQHGDYYLTSLLVKPLGTNRVTSRSVRVDFFTKQKKEFVFREHVDEIGGDLCMAAGIRLQDQDFTVFLNADAMGKSIQGAGGVLVLGSVFGAMLERTRIEPASVANQSPQLWLKNAYQELQKVFEAFDCTMLVSAVFGLVEDRTGKLYFVNAEHPQPILYRDGRARFVPARHMYHKIGTPYAPERFVIQALQMKAGDIVIVGSDGKDDVSLGVDDEGTRIINDNEFAILQHIENGRGALGEIYASVAEAGDIADDFSLLRIEFMGIPESDDRSLPEKHKRVIAGGAYAN